MIKACDVYTKWKFSLFKSGKKLERLNEVKMVRAEAMLEYKRLRKLDGQLPVKERKEKTKKRVEAMEGSKKLKQYYEDELQNIYNSTADSLSSEKKAIMKAAIWRLRDLYPAMDYEEAQRLALKFMAEKTELGKDIKLSYIDSFVSIEAKESAEKKRAKEEKKRLDLDTKQKIANEKKRLKEIERAKHPDKIAFDKYIENYNPVSKFFYKYIFSLPIKIRMKEETLRSLEEKVIMNSSKYEREAKEREKRDLKSVLSVDYKAEDYDTEFI